MQPDTENLDNPIAHIFQINASPGGVPKLPLARGEVTQIGLVGDKQRTTQVHGGPEAALCLYSLERILALQAEGHPIYPGAVGENLTIAGLDWDKVTPGTRLKLGEDVLIEVTRYTTPCSAIVDVFVDQKINRILQDKHPGWSRVYARVLRPGVIYPGSKVFRG
jgi:MOSC domain-containing protein YiiM